MGWLRKQLKTTMTDEQIFMLRLGVFRDELEFRKLGFNDRAEAAEKIRGLLR